MLKKLFSSFTCELFGHKIKQIQATRVNKISCSRCEDVFYESQLCKKCKGLMKPGKAIQSTLVGVGDFYDADEVVTVSYGGAGKLVDCWKCQDCGWSYKACVPI